MANGNRKAAEEIILHYIDKILPDGTNRAIYETLFKSMDDEQFEQFMQRLEDGQRLAIIAPNLSKTNAKIDVKRNLEIGRELGHSFFQKIYMDRGDGGPKFLSNVSYFVGELPLRRQAQLLVKKISIPEDNRSVDYLTGQPTGSSKGAKISYPELQILTSHGLYDPIVELIKYRGGDSQGFNAMNNSIAKTGGASMRALDTLGTKVKSTQTLSTYLLSMHYENTLLSN